MQEILDLGLQMILACCSEGEKLVCSLSMTSGTSVWTTPKTGLDSDDVMNLGLDNNPCRWGGFLPLKIDLGAPRGRFLCLLVALDTTILGIQEPQVRMLRNIKNHEGSRKDSKMYCVYTDCPPPRDRPLLGLGSVLGKLWKRVYVHLFIYHYRGPLVVYNSANIHVLMKQL